MTATILIPARYASTRFPGKPLVELQGASGQRRSLIRRSWDAAQAVAGVAGVHVVTDDARIERAARAFGAEVLMTPESCANGTERCAAALAALDAAHDIVVNLQGDAPLTPPWFVSALIDALRADPGVAVATPVLACDAATLDGLRADRRAGRVGGTTAVFDGRGRALYFSKEVLPFGEGATVYHHVGVYAYRREALERYATWGAGRLEASEGLEQLRFLENGVPVQCVEVSARGRAFWEVNNPEDVGRVETIMADISMT